MAVRHVKKRKGEAGFSLIQIMITVAVIAIVTAFATVRVLAARDHMRLTNAARDFAGVTERARIDSVRRHENGGRATVHINSPTTYLVFMDYNYTGNPSWRTYSLPEGVQFANLKVTQPNGTVVPSAPFPVAVSFSWRGLSDTASHITFQNTRGHTSFVTITSAGEVSLDRGEISLLAGIYNAVVGDSMAIGPGANPGGATGISGGAPPPPPTPPTPTPTPTPEPTPTPDPEPTPKGDPTPDPQPTATPDGTPTPEPTATPRPTATPTPTPEATPTPIPPCTMELSKKSLELHNGGNGDPTDSFTVTFNNPTADASFTVKEVSNTAHVTISVSNRTVTVTAMNGNGNRGTFTVRVTPNAACGVFQDVSVRVAK